LPITGGTVNSPTTPETTTITPPVVSDSGLPVVDGTTVALATPAPTTTSGSLADRLKAVPGLDSSIIASLVAVVGDSIKTSAAETIDLPLI
jgi:hypothetical protein